MGLEPTPPWGPAPETGVSTIPPLRRARPAGGGGPEGQGEGKRREKPPGPKAGEGGGGEPTRRGAALRPRRLELLRRLRHASLDRACLPFHHGRAPPLLLLSAFSLSLFWRFLGPLSPPRPPAGGRGGAERLSRGAPESNRPEEPLQGSAITRLHSAPAVEAFFFFLFSPPLRSPSGGAAPPASANRDLNPNHLIPNEACYQVTPLAGPPRRPGAAPPAGDFFSLPFPRPLPFSATPSRLPKGPQRAGGGWIRTNTLRVMSPMA